jgi:hypothetical protein
MKGETLQKVDHQPYLGVELRNNLKYNLHIDQTCKKASKVLGFLYFSGQLFKNVTGPLGQLIFFLKSTPALTCHLMSAQVCTTTPARRHQKYLVSLKEILNTVHLV